jgi:dTDP-4-amino-4,6-dideoxygalactose transaminase
LNKYVKVAEPLMGQEEMDAIAEVIKSGRFVQGPKVREFEEKFSEYIGVEHGIAVNSGTAALHVAIAALNIGPGDEVIVPSLTFFSTASSVIHQNAVPIFADIDPNTYCIDPDDIQEKITPRTKAIIPVHLYGHPAEMDSIMEIAEDNGLYVIEDAAQAHGAKYRGKKAGTIGHVGCFSFYATKNMTTGEGGIITTNNEKIAKKARMIRNHGMSSRDDHDLLGYNYRMNEMQAAIGIAQLSKLDMFNEARKKNSEYLLKNLTDVKWLILPKIKPYINHVYFWCPVRVDEKTLGMETKDLVKTLREKGVEVRHRYTVPLYKQKMFLNLATYPRGCPFTCSHYPIKIDYSKVYCKNVEQLIGKMIGLPNHPKLSRKDLDFVIDVIKNISWKENESWKRHNH